MRRLEGLAPWAAAGWRGWIAPSGVDPTACLTAVRAAAGRMSRHARTVRLDSAGHVLWVKSWAEPGGWRATRAATMGAALAEAGFPTPRVVLVARRGGAGLLVTEHVGGEDLIAALARHRDDPAAKRALLRRLGSEVGRLHASGFVHGDLVPSNVQVRGNELVLLDNDRTRHGRLLVRLVGRRNLVQLGRFVIPGVGLTDRARVLVAYAWVRGLGRERRRRLARWLVRKIVARRCAIDRIPTASAAAVGFRELMRGGGPFDPGLRAGGRS